jgi:hypothetical protein
MTRQSRAKQLPHPRRDPPNPNRTVTVSGPLGAISLVAIVLLLTGCNPSNSNPAAPSNSGYPTSTQTSIVSDCEQTYGAPASYCQCNLNWLEANIPYSMFTQDPATFEQQADGYASC